MRQKIRDLARRGLASRPGAKAPRWAVTAAVAALGLVIAIPASAMTSRSASAGRPAYLNASLPIQARVSDLLGRMTLPEKIGQMVQIEVTQVTDTSSTCTSQGGFNLPNPACEQKIFVDNNVGSILPGRTDIPVRTAGHACTAHTAPA